MFTIGHRTPAYLGPCILMILNKNYDTNTPGKINYLTPEDEFHMLYLVTGNCITLKPHAQNVFSLKISNYTFNTCSVQ